jgi:hypothetical protein
LDAHSTFCNRNQLVPGTPITTHLPLIPPVNRDTADLDFSDAHFSQPQADATACVASPAQPLPPEGYHNYNFFDRGDQPGPHESPYMPEEPETMQTPVSPISAHNSPADATGIDPQQPPPQGQRKRSHSVMSQQDDQLLHALQPPTESMPSPTGENLDEYSPRGSRAFKRGDPPTNEFGKYICDFADECRGQTFDRKCEWR